jgi:hypothetical protein
MKIACVVSACLGIFLPTAVCRASDTPDFATRVQPMMVKSGCFAGACHGAGSGQKGFKLSLLGYDSAADYRAIVYQFRGRRINLAHPEDSLILKKATMKLAHGGGLRFKEDSGTYRVVLAWLKGGAPYQGTHPRKIVALNVTPAANLLAKAGDRIQLRVVASFSDGSQDDVTRYALYPPNDESLTAVSDTGEVTVLRPGETGVTARYLGKFSTARVGVPFAGDPVEIARATAESSSFIDKLVAGNLWRLRLMPSPRATDSEFLRRVYLDLIGTLPSVEEVRAFLPDTRSDKRARVIDALLDRPEYSEYWSLWLLDLFRLNAKNAGEIICRSSATG